MAMTTVQSKSFWLSMVAALAWLASPGMAGSAEPDSLRKELTELAREVAKVLQDEGAREISVGRFAGPPGSAASSQPGITKVLTEELQKAGVSIGDTSGLEIQGSYAPVEDDITRRLAIMIDWSIVDRSRKILSKGNRGVFGDTTMAQVLGLTMGLPPDAPDADKQRTIIKAAESPEVYISGQRIAVKRSSRFAVEMLVKQGTRYVARKPTVEEGRAFVSIARDEIYAVRLINDSPHDAMAELTIDGLNCFEFCEMKDESTGGPRYRQVIIPAHASATVPGWYLSSRRFDAFRVTEYAGSVAAERKLPADSDGVGTITAAFFAAWSSDGDRPADEPNKLAMTHAVNATGRGPELSVDVSEVPRNKGQLRETVSVRYSK